MIQKNVISWFEIPTIDLDRAQKFYESILGVGLMPMDLDNFKMRMFPVEDPSSGIGGALCFSPEFYKPSDLQGTLVYLNANPDLQNVLDKVEKAGGNVLMPKTEISKEYGHMALIKDTEGNRIGLHSNS